MPGASLMKQVHGEETDAGRTTSKLRDGSRRRRRQAASREDHAAGQYPVRCCPPLLGPSPPNNRETTERSSTVVRVEGSPRSEEAAPRGRWILSRVGRPSSSGGHRHDAGRLEVDVCRMSSTLRDVVAPQHWKRAESIRPQGERAEGTASLRYREEEDGAAFEGSNNECFGNVPVTRLPNDCIGGGRKGRQVTVKLNGGVAFPSILEDVLVPSLMPRITATNEYTYLQQTIIDLDTTAAWHGAKLSFQHAMNWSLSFIDFHSVPYKSTKRYNALRY
ncbi:hypothetical protein R3P38DRAFT_3341414 [Favolaschia claudopus]|uniref:Uncharacterized protein n=1 Tax=Favolaschia claudopus TaxID=2862362 RepID=A0AAW0E7N6_9AGAR